MACGEPVLKGSWRAYQTSLASSEGELEAKFDPALGLKV